MNKTSNLNEYVIGLDVGGTKLLSVLMSSSMDIVIHHQTATPKGNRAVSEAILGLLDDVLVKSRSLGIDPPGIAVCAPGFIDAQKGIMIDAGNLWVEKLSIKDILANHYSLPVQVYHDVQSATLGEARYGAGIGRKNFAYLNLGTGVAVGLFLDGRLHHGANNIAGELGHIYMRAHDSELIPKAEHRLEALASGPALVHRAVQALGNGEQSHITELVSNQVDRITPQVIGQAARVGDSLALRIIEETTRILGVAVAAMVDVLDLECIIVGGGVASMGNILLDPLQTAVDRYAIHHYRKPAQIIASTLGEKAGVIGVVSAYFLGV